MINLFRIAIRNLVRYRRRTILTVSLIVIGLIFVQVSIAASNSMKKMVIGMITASMMGHIQIHRRGYISSVDNLPLHLNLSDKQMKKLESVLENDNRIEAFSKRIRFGGMLSNYNETTTIRLNGIDPSREFTAVPLLPTRVIEGKKELAPGEILVPVLLARGMNLKVGDPVVIVATNQDGSVNGLQLHVAGILENVIGPMGRDGYMHLDDAAELLRMKNPETTEVVIRLKEYNELESCEKHLQTLLSDEVNKQGKPLFEIHAWTKLHPFANIAKMMDILTFSSTLMLIAIVLISILNVMTIAVFERMREIGTILAMGTLPEKVTGMFLLEGLSIGLAGIIAGNILSFGIIELLRALKITFSFMRMDNFVLAPQANFHDFLFVSLIVLAVSTIASLQPALKASKIDPIKTLKQV